MKRSSIRAIASIVLFTAFSAHANLTLSRTRVIYTETSGHELVVMNKSDHIFGGQAWIDANSDVTSVNFVVHPQIFKTTPNGTDGDEQVVRIMKTGELLPQDRESLFYINVQEIPLKQSFKGDGIVVSFRNRVKLIYRPPLIESDRDMAEKMIDWSFNSGKITLNNPTPYYFAVTNVTINGVDTPIAKKEPLAPYSSIKVLTSASGVKDVVIGAINDYGASVDYKLEKRGAE